MSQETCGLLAAVMTMIIIGMMIVRPFDITPDSHDSPLACVCISHMVIMVGMYKQEASRVSR